MPFFLNRPACGIYQHLHICLVPELEKDKHISPSSPTDKRQSPRRKDSPPNSNCESPVLPVSSFEERHLPIQVRTGPVKDLMRVAVSAERIVRVRVSQLAIVGVGVGGSRHCRSRRIARDAEFEGNGKEATRVAWRSKESVSCGVRAGVLGGAGSRDKAAGGRAGMIRSWSHRSQHAPGDEMTLSPDSRAAPSSFRSSC